MSERLALTIDIGGTQSRVALIDGRSQIIKRASVPTESREGHKVVIEEIRKLVSQREFGRVAGIGISIAGLLKLDTGTLVYSPNMRAF